jgi:hypothetical protein
MTSISVNDNHTTEAKKLSDITPVYTPAKVVTESSKTSETPESHGILTESKKPEVSGSDINNPLSGSAQLLTASTVQSASPNNLTVGVSTSTTPSSVKVASIPLSSSLAKRASVFQQPASSTDSSTMGSTSSRKENKVLNPNFEKLKKTASQALIKTTKNEGFLGSRTTGSTTTTSSSITPGTSK